MRVPLNQGAYSARSLIAEAQRCVNLYPEKNPGDAIEPVTHYSCPGLTAIGGAPGVEGRGLYWANSNQLFYAAGNKLYAVSASWALTLIGTLATSSGIVSMADNGTTMVIVDGSTTGYQVTLSTLAFSFISAGSNSPPIGGGAVYAFYGGDRIDILDGFLLLNYPGTQSFYCTYNNEVVFDSLYFAEKNGYSDQLVAPIVSRREIWLIGQKTSEIWYDVGGATFPFAIMPGPFVQHGCVAKYSIAQVDGAIFWLSQDQAGQNIVVRGEGYSAKRISTHAIEVALAGYSTVSDAIGFCYQQEGHSFYFLTFPTADATWVWDEASGLWHERVWIDDNGAEHRHRANCAAFAYGVNVVADWQTGQLYQFDLNNATDNGQPIVFRRGFPHLMDDGKRVRYARFALDVEPATTSTNAEYYASLRWSDTRGLTWSDPVEQTLGAQGEYLTQPQWRRLGMARDRVFEVFGQLPGRIAINGAFIDAEPSES